MALDFERSSIGYAAGNQRIIEELIGMSNKPREMGSLWPMTL
jgi:hypothetical protein